MAMASLPRSWQDHGKILARLPRNLPWILARMPWLRALGCVLRLNSQVESYEKTFCDYLQLFSTYFLFYVPPLELLNLFSNEFYYNSFHWKICSSPCCHTLHPINMTSTAFRSQTTPVSCLPTKRN